MLHCLQPLIDVSTITHNRFELHSCLSCLNPLMHVIGMIWFPNSLEDAETIVGRYSINLLLGRLVRGNRMNHYNKMQKSCFIYNLGMKSAIQKDNIASSFDCFFYFLVQRCFFHIHYNMLFMMKTNFWFPRR